MKSRLPIEWVTSWAGFRCGWAFHRHQSGRGGRRGCSPLLSCMPADSATAWVRNGIESMAHVRKGGANGEERPCGGKFMRRRSSWKRGSERWGLFQLCVLRLGFLQDGNVGVGVFPEREEILIGGSGLDRVALHGVSTGQSQPGQRAPGKVHHQSSVLDEFLKFCCRWVAVVEHEIGLSPQISGAQQYREVHWGTKFDRARHLQ